MVKSAVHKAYELGKEYERTYRGCGQCIVAAIQDALGLDDNGIYQTATGFAGGVGMAGDSGCGSYLGAIVLLSSLLGRPRSNMKDPEGIRFQTHKIVRGFHDKFIQEYGSVNCRDIQMKLLGRSYYLADPDEMEKFHNAGGHDVVCPEVVGKAAMWMTEIILEKNLLHQK